MSVPGHILHDIFYSRTTFMSYNGQQDQQIYLKYISGISCFAVRQRNPSLQIQELVLALQRSGGKSVRSWCDGSSDRSTIVDPLSYFSFQLVLHDWCTKGRGMCYPVCRMVHIKEPLLLIGKSSPCGGSGCPLSLSVWNFTICLTPYNRK